MITAPIRIGIVGTNFVSDWLAEAVAALDFVKTTAVYSRKQQTGDAFAAKHGIRNVFCDYEAFLCSDQIDAVYIASPNFMHCSQTIAALEHKKHVLCEKVIATNEREFGEMMTAAKRNECVLLEAMRPSHDPCTALIKKHLSKLGKLRRAVFDYCQYSSRYDRFLSGEVLNAFDPTLSNAAVMDIGVYVVHMAAKLFGEPQGIVSVSTKLSNGFEGAGHVILDYGDMKAELSYSKICDTVTPNVLMGERGSLLFEKISAPRNVRILYRDGSLEKIAYEPIDSNMIYEVQQFAKLIRDRDYDHCFLQDSLIEMKILDEIRRQNGICFPSDEPKN